MSQILNMLLVWLHALATVVFVGHYILLAAIYLPVLSTTNNGAALSAISKRSRRWLYASILVLIVTGTWLMLVDPDYRGFMQFDNLWSIAMIVKHVLIVAMIGLGFWYNAVRRVGPMMQSPHGGDQAIAGFRRHCTVMAIAGALVLLLTAVAQGNV